MEAALEKGDLVASLSHPAAHTTREMPTLHYLASLAYQPEDAPHLDKLIKILILSGYDLNATTHPVSVTDYSSRRLNALCASIIHNNRVFMEVLLRNGAQPDLRTDNGSSPALEAIKKGHLECLEMLVQFGGTSLLATSPNEKLGERDVHPALHTAAEKGHPEIVSYLLTMEEFGVNLHEKAVYKMGGNHRFEYTPWDAASIMGHSSVMKILLEALCKDPRFSDLYLNLAEGDTQAACSLLDNFSPEELASGKIEDRWALHILHPRAFEEEARLEFTKEVILHFVQSGWHAESESVAVINYIELGEFARIGWVEGTVSRCTLLHLACYHKAQLELIRWLVEEVGVDVNCKTEGEMEVTPLFILIAHEMWEAVAYLVEKGGDLSFRGKFVESDNTRFSNLFRKNLTTGEWEPPSSLNLLELSLRMGFGGRPQLLDTLLSSPSHTWRGAVEYHLAVEGRNPNCVLKVLEKCAGMISQEDLVWIPYCDEDDNSRKMITPLFFLMRAWNPARHNALEDNPLLTEQDVRLLIRLVELLVSAGLDINASCYNEDESIFELFELNLPVNSPQNLVLLQTILNVKDLRLNVNYRAGFHPIQLLSDQLRKICWELPCVDQPENFTPWPVDAIKLLVTHGMDVSGFNLDACQFHFGCSAMFKMLLEEGATVSEDFFTPKHLCYDERSNERLREEFAEVQKWKEELDRKEALTLKHLCRLRIWKSAKCVENVEEIVAEKPNPIQNYVLSYKNMFKM